MRTFSEYQKTIESHKDYYKLGEESDYVLVITVDPYMLNDIARRNATYHRIVDDINEYFMSKSIETLIVPAMVGRGAVGGGFNLIYFIISNFESTFAFVKSALLMFGIIRKLNNYRKRRRHDKNHKKYAVHSPVVTVSLAAVLKKDKDRQHSASNYDSIVYLLNVLPDLNEVLTDKYVFITFHFNLSAFVEDSESSYSVSLSNLKPTPSVIGEIFEHIDKQYVSNYDRVNHVFTKGRFGLKHRKTIKLSEETCL